LLAKQSLQKRCALLVLDDDAKETDDDDDDVDDEDDVKDAIGDSLVVSNRNPPNSRVTLLVVA
jgi:hypothetical protein